MTLESSFQWEDFKCFSGEDSFIFEVNDKTKPVETSFLVVPSFSTSSSFSAGSSAISFFSTVIDL